MDLTQLTAFITPVAKEFVFPAAAFVVGYSVKKLTTFARCRAMVRVFGRAAWKPENLFLSLPLWTLKKGPPGTERYIRKTPTGGEDACYGPTEMVSADDLASSREITAFFAQFHAKTVPTVWDDRRVDLRGRGGVFIGSPVGNLLVKDFFQSIEGLPVRFHHTPAGEGHPHDETIEVIETQKMYRPDTKNDYALILRTPNPSDKKGYFIFICGLGAEPTLSAAIYFRNNWKRFAACSETSFIVLTMPARHPQMASVAEEHGF